MSHNDFNQKWSQINEKSLKKLQIMVLAILSINFTLAFIKNQEYQVVHNVHFWPILVQNYPNFG